MIDKTEVGEFLTEVQFLDVVKEIFGSDHDERGAPANDFMYDLKVGVGASILST